MLVTSLPAQVLDELDGRRRELTIDSVLTCQQMIGSLDLKSTSPRLVYHRMPMGDDSAPHIKVSVRPTSRSVCAPHEGQRCHSGVHRLFSRFKYSSFSINLIV